MSPEIVSRDDVRMDQLGHGLGLLLEPREHRRIGGLIDEDRLERDDAI